MRLVLVLMVSCFAPFAAGCGSSDAPLDMSVPDTGEPDAGLPLVGVCQACTVDAQCPLDADCLDFGPNRLCFARAANEFSPCPRTFEAAQLASTPGLFHCLPTEGCCIDEDDDNHGQGVFCEGLDCDDDDEFVYPGADELCDGEDDDCDGVEDDMAVDCDPAAQCVEGTCQPVVPG